MSSTRTRYPLGSPAHVDNARVISRATLLDCLSMPVAWAVCLMVMMSAWPARGREHGGGVDVADVIEEAGVCNYTAHDGDAALYADPGWRCTVQRARCLLGHGQQFCGNHSCEILKNDDIGYSSGATINMHGSPQLFCRTFSSIIWYWEQSIEHNSSVAYVISIREPHKEEWNLHDVVFESNFTLGNLLQNTTLQLRVQGLTSDGLWSNPCTSKWTSILNAPPSIVPVTNVEIVDYRFSETYTNVSIKWMPTEDDMSCDYKVVYWLPYEGLKPLEEVDFHKQFTGVLPYLKFDGRYEVVIFSMHFNPSTSVTNLHGNYSFLFTSPSCLQLWNNNLTVCRPPPAINLNITFLDIGDNSYAMNVSWEPGFLLPEEFIVSAKQYYSANSTNTSQNNYNRGEIVQVSGNVTSFQFRNIDPDSFYMVQVIAVSQGGNSTILGDIRKIRFIPSRNQEFSARKIVIITIVALLIIVIVSIVFFLFWKHQKRKEDSKISQFFPNLEKEPSSEKNYESAAIYFDDEWEIPEERLDVGNIIGEGAFGVVRKGLLKGLTPQESSQAVAVKTLKDPSSEDVRQFQLEINMMKSVKKHPHIVSIIGCCTRSKNALLIVEYCDFGDLHNYLQKNLELFQNSNTLQQDEQVKYAELLISNSTSVENETVLIPRMVVNQMYFDEDMQKTRNTEVNVLQPADLLSFARQIAMGMEFLASNRIVHRDLATRNVLVCSSKTVKISDFGRSRDIYERNMYHKKGPERQPIRWLAIESLMFQIFTIHSDVWSFGILLWEIVTMGAVPYPSTPTTRIFQLLKSGYRMECPNNCSQELYEIMLACWRDNPKERPTFTELRNKLDGLLENSSPQQYLNLNIMNFESFDHQTNLINEISKVNVKEDPRIHSRLKMLS